jgi:micrococcal nuclease
LASKTAMSFCILAWLAAACFLGAFAKAADMPHCVPKRGAQDGKVVSVGPPGALTLADGRVVRLEGLLLAGAGERMVSALGRQAIWVLSDLARDRDVILAARAPREDRYGRIRAQVIIPAEKRVWLQSELLRRGLARVSIAPDRPECARELYTAEQEARLARRGIWASRVYAVRSPNSLEAADLGTFQIVEGEVLNATVRGGRAYLNFGRNWRTDFTVTISPRDFRSFMAAGIDPRSYAGRTVRARGWIERLNGPEIEAAIPEQIEIIASDSAPRAEQSAK